MAPYEKLPNPNGHQPNAPNRRSTRLAAIMLLAIAAIYYLLGPSELNIRKPKISRPKSDVSWMPQASSNDTALVPLEIHIMSKCPDARDCLKKLILPTMESAYSKVNFTMSFIGESLGDDGVECMHGETECLGNIVELCAANLYPDPKIYLGFTMCLSNDYAKIPQEEFVEGCALEHGVDFNKLNGCMSRDDGDFAMRMLRESFERSKAVKASKSCTVRLDEEVWCIRDGGEWTDCEEDGGKPKTLIKQIEGLYSNASSAKRV